MLTVCRMCDILCTREKQKTRPYTRRMNKLKNENKDLLTLLENDNNFRFEVKHAILSQISTIEKRINSIKEMRHQDEFTADTVRHYQEISLKNLNKFLDLLDEI